MGGRRNTWRLINLNPPKNLKDKSYKQFRTEIVRHRNN